MIEPTLRELIAARAAVRILHAGHKPKVSVEVLTAATEKLLPADLDGVNPADVAAVTVQRNPAMFDSPPDAGGANPDGPPDPTTQNIAEREKYLQSLGAW